SVIETLTQRNEAFSSSRFSADLKIVPSMKTWKLEWDIVDEFDGVWTFQHPLRCKTPRTRPASHDLVTNFRPELSYRLDPEWISRCTIKRDRHLPTWQQQYRGCERGPRHGQKMGLPGRSVRFFKGFSRRKARVSDRVAFPVKFRSGERHRCDRVHPGAQLLGLAWL